MTFALLSKVKPVTELPFELGEPEHIISYGSN